jgi:hypothetical protein
MTGCGSEAKVIPLARLPHSPTPDFGTQTALGALAARDAADLARAPFGTPGVAEPPAATTSKSD